MSSTASIRYLAFLFGLVAVLGGLAMIKGAFLVQQHEGDALHLAQIMLLLTDGWRMHMDFSTPIGDLAFWPISVWMAAGLPLGKAFFLGQILVAVLLMPAIFWIGLSRFSNGLRYVMGAVILVWVLGLVHGEAAANTSVSMHYNRWAWAIAGLILFVALLPARGRERPWFDALILGVGMAVLGLMKATFAVALIPGVILALATRKQTGLIVRGLVAGGLFLGVYTAFAGIDFWSLYLNDLISVMDSAIRSKPHRPLGNVVGAPDFMGATLLLVGAILVLRHGGKDSQGLALLLLGPALIYITYQNFGNDPKWLLILGLCLAMLMPRPGQASLYGADLRQVQFALVIAAFALNAPSFFNIATSGWRNRAADITEYQPLIPGTPVLADLLVKTSRANQLDILIPAELNDMGVDDFKDVTDRPDSVEIRGEMLPYCSMKNGFADYMTRYADESRALGVEKGSTALVADVFSPLWIYGVNAPVKGMSPWLYGGAPGLERVTYLSVPLCPIHAKARKIVVEAAFSNDQVRLDELSRGKLQILYRVTPATGSQ